MSKKKIIIIVSVVIGLIVLTFIGSFIKNKTKFSKLSVYTKLDNEYVFEEFKYKGNNYKVTAVYTGRDPMLGTDVSYINFLFEKNDKLYLLKSTKQCYVNSDIDSIYVDGNDIYIHCLNTKGNIYKYTINNFDVSYEIYYMDYEDTPNISQIHIGIDKVDGDKIYLSSKVRLNSSLMEGNNVICSLKKEKCEYDPKNGIGKKDMNYNEEQQHIYDLLKKELINKGRIKENNLKDFWIDSIFEEGYFTDKPNYKYIQVAFNCECISDDDSCVLLEAYKYNSVLSTYNKHSNSWIVWIVVDSNNKDYIQLLGSYAHNATDSFEYTSRVIKDWE